MKDGEVRVNTHQARSMSHQILHEGGLFVGFSAGTAMPDALHVARPLTKGVVVTGLVDSGAKYVSLR